MGHINSVIPAKAGIQISIEAASLKAWTPACAGMTGKWF